MILVAMLATAVTGRTASASTLAAPSLTPLPSPIDWSVDHGDDPVPAAPTWLVAVRDIVARLMAHTDSVVAVVAVDLYDVNGDKSGHFDLPVDGLLAPERAQEVAKFFSCRRSGRVRPLHPGVIAMLAEIGLRYPGHVIEIVSGYRGTREERRTSPHKAGRAIDLRVRGVKTAEVRDWLWSAHTHVGIGFYPHGDYLHMDTRPTQKDTAWTQRKLNADNDYHPRWARTARRASR